MIPLPQTGRAGLQFLGDLQVYSSSTLLNEAKSAFYEDPEMSALGDQPMGDRPREELDALVEKANKAAAQIPAHRFNRLYQRMVAEAVYDRGIPAAEEKRPFAQEILAAKIDKVHPNVGTLTLDETFEIPDYAADVEWHLMPGGWDGYDLSFLMFMSGVMPYIFKKGGYAAVDVGVDIFSQRAQVIDQLPEGHYKRIYEAGCGGTPTLAILRQKFPDAELVGSDLSASMLQGGHKMDQKMGLNVHLKQEDCRYTSEPDNHYDAVVSYAVFHETPDNVCFDILKEMHRILAPGGHILISDPGPFRALSPYQAVLYDWEQDNREEPHFGASIRRHMPNMMREIGYDSVQEYNVGPYVYPWVTLGRKAA